MDHIISIDGRETRATPEERLEDLKARNVLPPHNQRWLEDGDLSKIMDRDLYKATKEGDVEKFMDALETVSQSRELALSLIFDQVTPSGDSLLHVAASSGKENVMELILNNFPYLVTRRNSSEDTPLHVAIRTRSLEATRKLIRLRRDAETMYWKNKDSKSPLYLAAESGYKEILKLLLEACAGDEAYAGKIQGMSPVLAPLGKWNPGILEEIIDRLPKLLHVRGEDGGTPLHSAASVGDLVAVEVLLRECPDLALQTDKNGSYPIHIACQGWGSGFTVDQLVQATWPDLAEIKNNKGQNILHVAAKAGNNIGVFQISWCCDEAVIKELANSKDVDGNTPLHLASMHNHCRVMLYLTRDNRSDLTLLNNDKLTALDVAMNSASLSTKYPALLGRAILITAGVPQSGGRDVWSPRENAEWMKDEVNTRLLVATLVATVTFAAGFTLPGGYNASSDPRPGTATMLHNKVFQVFVISNMLAMYSSVLAVVVLLWGHISDFYVAEQAYLTAGPLLLMALTGMSVAFLAGVSVAVSKITWLAFLLLCIAIFFLVTLVMVLGALIFPFSKTAMHIVSLYYLVGALPRYAVRRFKHRNDPERLKSDVYFF
ncbi:protein ACCELERATED CELL DEATH 6-like isoform X2 [Rhodamnia argentea]|uniref:Protein ACCELERATED CELL DEATH 6-like isoform X2 n=1 Tax=Rhodamnia argentea TaxID=178133 RepID=A0ABM3HMI5_9MYRT|nr:protein ACCELERATED CELL DEATH 6-like isoform X2 [Rhodamnia argentea]